MTPGHDLLAPLAAEYVLGALSDADAKLFREHLRDCGECQRAVAEMTTLGESLARSLEPIAPPRDLRARVIARATGTSSIDTRSRSQTPWTWLAAAAALIAAIMTATTVYYRNEAIRARGEQIAAAQQVRTLEQQIASLQANAATAAQTTTVLTAADLSRVDLAGQTAAPGAVGRVFWSPTNGLVFAATNLPPLPPGRVYQLWIVAGQPISAGIAEPSAGGFSVVNPAGVTATPKAFAVTIEPEGGRPAPTGPMFLLGSM
jgi:anti-sigma-K factor RskA